MGVSGFPLLCTPVSPTTTEVTTTAMEEDHGGHDHEGHDHSHGDHHEHEQPADDEKDKAPIDNGDDEEYDEYVTLCGCIRMKNLPLFVAMNTGECFHVFTDGIFIGTAYLACPDLAPSIAVVTFLHELPNQLATYFIMLNQNGMKPWVALIVNFVLGFALILGGILVLAFNFSDVFLGCLLAMGGGTFLHVAMSELLINAENSMKGGIQMVYMFIAFAVGAVPIGLVLINHQHC